MIYKSFLDIQLYMYPLSSTLTYLWKKHIIIYTLAKMPTLKSLQWWENKIFWWPNVFFSTEEQEEGYLHINLETCPSKSPFPLPLEQSKGMKTKSNLHTSRGRWMRFLRHAMMSTKYACNYRFLIYIYIDNYPNLQNFKFSFMHLCVIFLATTTNTYLLCMKIYT